MVIAAEESETRDIELDIDEDIERKHKHKKRKKKKQQQYGPCGFGRDLGDSARSFGFGDKLFGQSQPDYTYINAPVNNYYIGCGGASYNPGQSGGHGGHGHGGHGGHGNGGHGNHGHEGQNGHNGHGSQGNQGFGNHGNQQFGGFNPYQQGFASNQYYPQNSPVQGAFSAAASSIGTALADYISRPRKAQRQIKQLLRPIYRLF